MTPIDLFAVDFASYLLNINLTFFSTIDIANNLHCIKNKLLQQALNFALLLDNWTNFAQEGGKSFRQIPDHSLISSPSLSNQVLSHCAQ